MFQVFNMHLVLDDIAHAGGLQVQRQASLSRCHMGMQRTVDKGSVFCLEMSLTDALCEPADPAGFSATPLTPIHVDVHKPTFV